MVDFDNNQGEVAELPPQVGTYEFMRERDDGDFDLIKSVNGVQELVRVIPEADKNYPNGRPDPEQEDLMARDLRNGYLAVCDFTQLPDYPSAKKAEWATYRNALRNLPDHENWPILEEGDWPVPPEAGVMP